MRIGYDFAGWTPTDNIPTGSTGDKAFTATWTPSVYTIHYYLNGGTNDAANPATYTTGNADHQSGESDACWL
ncbi:MAG: hypothetical protein R2912_00790 [Eubacteriales bacterium]